MHTEHDRAAFGHWLSGFTDGEGCFYLAVRKHQSFPSPFAQFSIKLRADDRPIIEAIHSFWGCGLVYDLPRARSGDTRRVVSYCVHDIESLSSVVVPHFAAYPLRAKKSADFAIWSRAVALLRLVSLRPRRSRGGRSGGFPKWASAEVDAFRGLVYELKASRTFRVAVVTKS